MKRRGAVALLGLMIAGGLFCARSIGGQAGALASVVNVEVTYVANEGFLLSGGGKKVLVDALFRDGVRGYAVAPADMRSRLEAAQSPFDGVSLILVTHAHSDHFDAQAVGAHLMGNSAAALVAVPDVTDQLKAEFKDYAYVSSRVHTVFPGRTGRTKHDINGITVEVLRAPHGRAQHAAYLITLGGKKFLHLGDSDGGAADFAPLHLERDDIDVAFLPDWYLLYPEWPEVVRKHIRPKRIVAMHVAIDNNPDPELREHLKKFGGHAGLARKIQAEFPGTIVALVPGARFRF